MKLASPEATMSGDDRTARARIERTEKFRFDVSFPDIPGAARVAVDEPPPLGDATGPNPAALLAAALGSCLSASLVFCLKKARIEPEGVTADVTARIVRNDRGRYRIGDVDVSLALALPNGASGAERCQEIFEDFCIVTESVRHGIPVNVRLTQQPDRARQTPAA
jgi:uncharacterized OsmC-like protein